MPKILIVDDNEINLKLLERIIVNNTSCNIESAYNGKEAIELVTNDIDLIFMDMMMPVIDGYKATKTIKEDSKLSHIPIIAITAVNTKEEIKKVFECGCDDILQKPISVQTVVDLIEKYMKIS